jgi:hypothetical protein
MEFDVKSNLDNLAQPVKKLGEIVVIGLTQRDDIEDRFWTRRSYSIDEKRPDGIMDYRDSRLGA